MRSSGQVEGTASIRFAVVVGKPWLSILSLYLHRAAAPPGGAPR